MHESTFRRMVWKSSFGEACWGEDDAFPLIPSGISTVRHGM
jgi:hypothetical protein